ncbi:hypothetical protein NEOLEDRAFT_1131066 [Neolentinus lepideus HHB14362 ss-1]|uniref:Uncharacterized protein n=1 Tax=Neolentinus lepideus HHB14362 ss-1 TaxID=1314782 RepID=A0A165TRZ3_9AGAM|nr:hypothetical protein NEOLEDRAFT_1131066 [Neolentinus lepideus HHB14362 ss-1]
MPLQCLCMPLHGRGIASAVSCRLCSEYIASAVSRSRLEAILRYFSKARQEINKTV